MNAKAETLRNLSCVAQECIKTHVGIILEVYKVLNSLIMAHVTELLLLDCIKLCYNTVFFNDSLKEMVPEDSLNNCSCQKLVLCIKPFISIRSTTCFGLPCKKKKKPW